MNPYVTVDEAQVFFDTVLETSDWDEASDETKLKALISATRLIDNLAYKGIRNTEEHEFPRDEEVSIPQPIKDATCEIALVLLQGKDVEQEIENLNMVSMSFGQAKASFSGGGVLQHTLNGIPSATAWMKLKPYLIDPTEITILRTS